MVFLGWVIRVLGQHQVDHVGKHLGFDSKQYGVCGGFQRGTHVEFEQPRLQGVVNQNVSPQDLEGRVLPGVVGSRVPKHPLFRQHPRLRGNERVANGAVDSPEEDVVVISPTASQGEKRASSGDGFFALPGLENLPVLRKGIIACIFWGHLMIMDIIGDVDAALEVPRGRWLVRHGAQPDITLAVNKHAQRLQSQDNHEHPGMILAALNQVRGFQVPLQDIVLGVINL